MEKEKMIEKFQCPGCVCGADTKCEAFKLQTRYDGAFFCENHVLGTTIWPSVGSIALGLPKGFNRAGFYPFAENITEKHNRMYISLYKEGNKPNWDKLNVPVWALVKDDFLFVRTFCPRVNVSTVEVIENGSLDMVPNAINVGEFHEEID